MVYVPDNYDLWKEHDRKQEENELEFVDVPNDYGTHKELYPNYKEEE